MDWFLYDNVLRHERLSNFIEITHRYGCSPVNLLHIFRIPFLKNTFRWLRLSLPCYLLKISEIDLPNLYNFAQQTVTVIEVTTNFPCLLSLSDFKHKLSSPTFIGHTSMYP